MNDPQPEGHMASHIGRRAFITLLGGVAAWPLAARAQQPATPMVGFINLGVADASANRVAAFRKGLSEAGYAEGQNVIVEYHWLEGHYERLPAVLADLVRRRVAVITTSGSIEAALAAKTATATIPIVFGVPEDPVKLGIVVALEIDAKRLGLMHELLPKATRYAVLVNPANAAGAQATSKAAKEAARALGLDALFFDASTPAEIDGAFAAFGLPARWSKPAF